MNLRELIMVYGKDNVVPISFLKQIIFYANNGCQPKFVYESEKQQGKIVCWYLKKDTVLAKKKWDLTK
jgi:hypothetical protein